MAGSSLLALLDDIASILDDVSLMTKVAAKKTAGVLGDDLALNAQQVAVVVGIALIRTVGVYGLVAGIVKLDDAGFYLAARKGAGALMNGVRAFGRMLVSAAPKLMKFLSVVGTLAMFMVGGGILTHGWPWASTMLHHAEVTVAGVAGIGPVLAAVTPSLINAVAGLIAGGLVLAGVTAVSALLRMIKPNK